MENFYQYPVGIERVLTASEFMLFCTMYNQWRLMKNEKEYYFRSFEDLSDDCTLSLRSIKTIVKEFKNKGILESVAGSKKKGHANEYRFNLEVILSLINDNSVNRNKSANSALINDGNCNEIKVQKMSNKSANSAHHKEIKTKENNVKYIYHTGISSNEKSNNVANVMNDNEKNNNNLSSVPVNISDTSNFEISENEGIEVVNEKSNSVANGMNDNDTMKENYSHNISVDNNIKAMQSTTQQFSVSTKNINLKGSAAVGAENLRNGAGSVITSEVEQLPTATEITQNTAPLYSNTASNGEIDMFYLQHGITREEYDEAQRSFFKSSWRSLPCKFNGQTLTMSKVLDKLNEKDKDGKQPREANTYFFIVERLERYAQHYLNHGQMNQADFDDYDKVVTALSTPYFAYWKKVFENRMPNKMNPSEISMWKLLGCPQPSKNNVEATEKAKVEQLPTATEKTQNTAPSYSNTVTLPSLKELYKMSVADAEQTIFDFAANNTNIPLKDKVYFNENICGAFGISPQYVI